MVTYLPRSAWGARAPRGSTALIRSEVKGVGIHYPGMGNRAITSQASVASALRGWQDYHMDDRGWSDIAYQVAVDQAGRAWTLRGLNIKSAANGDQAVNRAYGAILLVIGDNEALSEQLKATTRAVVADFRRWYPAGTLIRPHSAIRPEPTSCPGDRARLAIERGEFVPAPTTGDDMSAADVQAINTNTNAAIARIESSLKAGIDGVAARLETELANAIDASGRKWALYQVLYGLETEDDRAAAQEAYRAAKAAGKTEAEALAAAEAKLAGLRADIQKAQAKG